MLGPCAAPNEEKAVKVNSVQRYIPKSSIFPYESANFAYAKGPQKDASGILTAIMVSKRPFKGTNIGFIGKIVVRTMHGAQ